MSGSLDQAIEVCDRKQLPPPVRTIFVFGSNLAGRHGAGAALWARNHYGARYGQGEGLSGMSYALPTKDERISTLPLARIKKHVDRFLECARDRQDLTFRVTAIGCGLAGFQPEEIAPFFRDAPENCILPREFSRVLEPAPAPRIAA
jgi:hypothetical protein